MGGTLPRAVLMRAAVVGAAFDVHVVVATASYPQARVRSALELACRLQLILAHGFDRYSFRHSLTRDIVYAETVDTATYARVTRKLLAVER